MKNQSGNATQTRFELSQIEASLLQELYPAFDHLRFPGERICPTTRSYLVMFADTNIQFINREIRKAKNEQQTCSQEEMFMCMSNAIHAELLDSMYYASDLDKANRLFKMLKTVLERPGADHFGTWVLFTKLVK